MSKPAKFWDVKKSKTENSVDIFIYGMIGESWFSDGTETVASQFVPEFKELEEKYDRINVRINSPGGSVYDGLPVFNVISQSKKDVHTYVDGIAYSMAAIIALAGKQVHASKNSLILLHSPISIAFGNAKDFRATADDLDKYGRSLMSSVVSRTGLTEDEVKEKWFDYEDHMMNADEALSEKLIDDIIEEEGNIPDGIQNMTFRQVMNFYHEHGQKEDKFFDGLISKLRNVFNITPKKTKINDVIMENIEKFQQALNLKSSATVDDVLNAITALNQKVTDLESEKSTIQASLTEKTDALAVAESQLTAEVTAHAATKQAFEDFKNEDAAPQSTAAKDKDKISGSGADPANDYGHNKVADKVSHPKKVN
jgi:ATP-dependent Clp endopeptidase proteolytic subunit ClpP